ncbi:abortive infection protein [Devosia sp. H5989]|nr:abortive infection protein [Devosia sp. H5989]
MLYRVEVENFYSIRAPQVIDLRVAGNVPDVPGRFSPLWAGCKERAPKTVAIFGANASGKSTVLRVIAFLAHFLLHSFSAQPTQRILFDRFNDAEALSEPARFAVELGGAVDLAQPPYPGSPMCKYRYELEIGGKEQARVIREALYYWPEERGKPTRLFQRLEDGTITASSQFGLRRLFKAPLQTILRPNASVISTLYQLKHPQATRIWDAISTVLTNIFIERTEVSDDQIVRSYAQYPDQLQLLNLEIPRIDLGIQEVQIVQGANGPLFQFIHENLAVPMPLHLESSGTRHFVKLYPMIRNVLSSGGILLVDEMDASIHPMILPEILRWFHDPQRNPHNAQLWMTCHNVTLLDTLVKEEVIFTEKDSLGHTSVYSLKDFKGIRRDDNLYKKYLSGLFGAVPQIG